MHIQVVTVHNFRSIQEATFALDQYSLLIGENNAGKSNLINALRVFYEDGIKYNHNTDFPKFPTDKESWIEIEYKLTESESESLKKAYRSEDNILRVRKYLYSENKDVCKTNQSNIYCYENDSLSTSLFYGAKNISQAKLGKVIYVPEVNKTSDAMKLTGPSPFRDLINIAFKGIMSGSVAYSELQKSFEIFNSSFSVEGSSEYTSMTNIVKDINQSIESWGVLFGIEVKPIDVDTIVKTLVSPHLEDGNLNGARVGIESYGQGMQRHIIFTLIRLASKYTHVSSSVKEGVFDPQFVLLLFEEPEAFLHPCQQEILNNNLRKMAGGDQQVLITSHSPAFVSRNISSLSALIKINKSDAVSAVFQLSNNDIDRLFMENSGLYSHCCRLVAEEQTDDDLRKCLIKYGLGIENPDLDAKLEEESLRYLLWIDSERSSMFFANIVVICEGPTEKAILDYMLNEEWSYLKEYNLYILDSMGKFNIHRYMNLLGKLGIKHSVIFDLDDDNSYHKVVNSFIKENVNLYTQQVLTFQKDLEAFLDVELPARRDLKPINLMHHLFDRNIRKSKLEQLHEMLKQLVLPQPSTPTA